MHIIRQRGYARVGLIGNPSDGYGGKTISFTIRNFCADVVLYPWEQLEIIGSAQDKSRFGSLAELVEDVDLNGYYGGVRLVKATIKRFAEYCLAKNWTSPRGAILGALSDQHSARRGAVGFQCDHRRDAALPDGVLRGLDVIPGPSVAGPSRGKRRAGDRLWISGSSRPGVRRIGVHGLLADGTRGWLRLRALRAAGCGPAPAALSGVRPVDVQNIAVRSRPAAGTRAGQPAVGRRPSRKSPTWCPRRGARSQQQDVRRLHQLLNRNFDLRSSLYNIRPSHRRMIDTARSVGASAKFAGSGGSVVGTYADESMFERLRDVLTHTDPNWRIIKPVIALPRP